MKRLALLALAALVSGCSDGAGPEPVAAVDILHDAAPVNERRIEVGETLQLSASLETADGSAVTGRTVEWKSSLPSVATVSETGLVTGVSPGETIVTATAEGVSDDVLIIVQAPLGSLACVEGDAGLALDVGEVHTTTAAGSPVMCLAGGASGSEYVLVPFNADSAANNLQVEVVGSGLIAATGPPNPSRFSDLAAGAGLSVPELREDLRFHARLRELERRELTPLVGGGGPRDARFSRSSDGQAASVPNVGEVIRYNVDAEEGCSNPRYRWAEVMAISDRAVVVADTLNPSGGFTQADYEHIAITFDTLVHPTVTSNFGEPVDIDENGGRSVILYTGAVNELTSPNSTSFVGGFFFSRDLFPRTATSTMSACPASNEAEMLYMLVPDPTGEINNNERSKAFVEQRTIGVLAHELQHLINASRRLYIVQAGGQNWVEQVWLNEGLSHIAEELTFYASTPHEPEQNIDVDDLRANQAVFDRFIEYQWSNFGRYISYLRTPQDQSLMGVSGDDDLETRGATWAFLRYLADQRGGTEAELWKSLVDSNQRGLANLNAALNQDPLEWMRRWTVSVYTDDAVPTTALYQQPSWDFRNIITSLRNGAGNLLYPTFPLRVIPLGDGPANEEELTLQGGGAAFLRFGVAAGGQAALRATSGGASAPSRLRISIVRTK